MSNYRYQVLENKPIGCTFCGAHIQGKITESKDPKTKEIIKECRWICARCGNLTKVGIVK